MSVGHVVGMVAGACLAEPFLGKVVVYEPEDRSEIETDIGHIRDLIREFEATRVVILHSGDSSRDDVSFLTTSSLSLLACIRW